MPETKPITPFGEIEGALEEYRRESRTIVHAHGVFDLLHIGHIRYLQAAKRLGDVLVVTVTPDRYVRKGPHRPVFDEKLRAQAIAALACVDLVAINPWPTATETLQRVRPDIYVKGAEFRDQKTPELVREEAEAAALGVRVEFIDDITSSSSTLINSFCSPFSDEADQYLLHLRQTQSAEDICQRLEAAGNLRVLVVGEAIIDEYVACSTLGQSTKSPNVVGRYQSQQRFPGGALAVANHLATFCGEVKLIAMLGAEQSCEGWIREQLRDSIQPAFIQKPAAPTIVKRQYRESYFSLPLFEVDYLDEEPLGEAETGQLCDQLARAVPECDLIVVADYGHTMLGKAPVQVLSDRARFLAVSVQANAGNLGYLTVSKYPRADYLSLAEQELRLECRSRHADLSEMLEHVAQALAARVATVTVGKRGCLCFHSAGGRHGAPALATRVVDRFGAGEAFFAVTAVCAALDFPPELLSFLGNVAGAEAVAVVGNSTFVEKVSFFRHVQSLMR
jgi:rfaE bifunctional protein nucleotidyltransferase chain/domain